MPVPAVLSILHRISGVVLFLTFPVAVYFFDLALRGPAEFLDARNALSDSFAAAIAMYAVAWALVHHLLAGVRYLFMDAGIGVKRNAAQVSAWLVFWAELAIMFLIVGLYFL